jgi:rhodanese-related sulfurtransferase
MFYVLEKTERTTPITPNELARLLTEGRAPVLVDVRGAKDYQKGHLPGALHIPFDELKHKVGELDLTLPTVFY